MTRRPKLDWIEKLLAPGGERTFSAMPTKGSLPRPTVAGGAIQLAPDEAGSDTSTPDEAAA